jgi:predicted PurR-regulated permease PerM
LLVLAAGVAAVLALVVVVAGSADSFGTKVPEYGERLEVMKQGLVGWLAGKGVHLTAPTEEGALDPQQLLDLAKSAVNAVGSLLSDAALILLLFVFMMIEAAEMRPKLSAVWRHTPERLARVDSIVGNIRRYVSIKTWISLLTGGLAAAWLAILGVDYPLLWGLVAFLFNFVPNIGSIIAAIPPVCLALVQIGVPSALYTAIGYIVINNVVGNIIEPRVMGRGLGLSTLVVFLSLIFWGWVLGPVGMILSAPLTMIAKIALEGSDETKWIGVLLGTGPPPSSDNQK